MKLLLNEEIILWMENLCQLKWNYEKAVNLWEHDIMYNESLWYM